MPIIGGRTVSVRGLGFQGAAKPNPPTINSATVSSSTSVTISWTQGSNNGAPITSVAITSSPSITLTYTNTDIDGSILVTGSFAINTAYTFTMTTTNAVGTSNTSNISSSITPNLDPSFIVTASGTYGFRSVAVNPNNNYQYYGTSPTNGAWNATVILNNDGNLISQPALSSGNSSWGSQTGIGLDSSNNWYLAQGYPESSGGNNKNAAIFKYNSSNVLQWVSRLDYGNTDEFYHISVSSSGSCVGTGYTYNTGSASYNGIIAKCNSSGVGQWSKYITSSGFIGPSAQDASENVYTLIDNGNAINVIKLNSSGVHQWTQRFSTSGSYSASVKLDSSGNIYVLGGFGTPTVLYLAKLNSSGAIVWQRTLSGTSSISVQKLFIDSNGNVYVTSYVQDTNYKTLIAKYNSSGTIQWQRFLSSSAGSLYGYGIALNASETSVIVAGQDTSGTIGYTIKVPADGSKIGSYTVSGSTWTYEAGNLTDAAGSMTVSSNSTSFTDGNALSTTTNPTSSTWSYSLSKVTL